MNLGEVSGVAVNSKGDVAIFTRSNSAGGPAYGATASQVLLVRQDRQVPARGRQGLYALVVRARHPLRQGRQPLGHRQRLGHDRPHQPRRPRDDGVRPQEGSVRRGRAVDARRPRRARRSTASSASRPTSRGTPRATSTSATATSTRASRSSPRTATGWRRSASRAAASSAQLNTPHSIANDAKGNIYVADRGNRRIQVIDPKTNQFVREIKIDVPVPPDAKPWMGATPTRAKRAAGAERARRGRSASRRPTRRARSSSTASDAFPGRIYKLTLDGKVLGMLGKSGHQAEAVRLDPRNRLPDRRTRSTSRSCSTGGCRSSR